MIDTSNKEIQSHYDFIVVGAGAAGSVIAAELSASDAQVLLVESGGPDDAPTIDALGNRQGQGQHRSRCRSQHHSAGSTQPTGQQRGTNQPKPTPTKRRWCW